MTGRRMGLIAALLLVPCLILGPGLSGAAETPFAASRVVYDVKSHSLAEFENILDRVSYLNSRLGGDPLSTSIVIVLHGDEINMLAREHELEYQDIVTRARSLTVGETIEFRVCKVSAKKRGYGPEDLQAFVQVVPMADAEIVQLQFDGYAYMR